MYAPIPLSSRSHARQGPDKLAEVTDDGVANNRKHRRSPLGPWHLTSTTYPTEHDVVFMETSLSVNHGGQLYLLVGASTHQESMRKDSGDERLNMSYLRDLGEQSNDTLNLD